MPFALAGVRRNAVFLLALIFALVTGVLVYSYLSRFGETLPVVVAARDIPGPQLLTDDDLRVVQMPAAAIHPQSLQTKEGGVGRWLTTPAVSGQPLLTGQLAQGPAGGSPLQIVLEADQVGFFLPAPLERLLGGAVSAGDRVDLIFVGGDRQGGMRSELLVPSVLVLDVRDQDGQSWTPEAGRRELPAGVVLAVTAADAQRLAFALDQGVVHVALRSAFAADNGAWAPGITWGNLLANPAESAEVEVDHGEGGT